ncbi:GNAT family N-acetyltransferase [Enterococcus sp. BWM-S5]|uniref:GNAT family N-acetyltransferase n=1 Tax=Enterococcus larvae TaxID=2794352 RepID=A0ABS4CH23_9ENTE|nr:GNAT family N-acetyltransferase [Enterococcus larvae]MBP1045724.1 GNAT family N-acetyltransferase [Enterococcus larvae]
MEIISIRENPDYQAMAIDYFQKQWGSEESNKVYEDAITHYGAAAGSLPQWYLLMDHERILGCAGLITNDFISRMDLYPWLCALYIDEEVRGKGLSRLLIEKVKEDTKAAGFKHLYLCTDHIGFYEKQGFVYIGDGYHPWGEKSRVYAAEV